MFVRSQFNRAERADDRSLSVVNLILAVTVVTASIVIPAYSPAWIEGALGAVTGRESLAEDIAAGETERAEQWLRSGASVDQRDAGGYTPLIWAAETDDIDLVRRLLEAGAEPSAASNFGLTPLSTAAAHGRIENVRLILRAGAAVDQPDFFGGTALHAAAWEGQTEAVAVLLANGADVNARDHQGLTALARLAFVSDKPGVADVTLLLVRAGGH